jgi:coenzyme F420-reducing hydrogenase delta subunit
LKSTIVVFSCNWNRAAAEGMLQLHVEDSSAPFRHIPVMCSGRVQPSLVLKAFERGAAGVALVRCAQDECHYGFGSRFADQNMGKTRALLQLLGIGIERVRQWSVGSRDLPDFQDNLAVFEESARKAEIPYAGKH